MELKRVVITGIGAISPLGATARETWEAVVAGKSGAGPITLFDASKFKTTFACEVKEFDVSKYIDKKEARRLDRYAQFAMVAAEESIADSKLDVETVNKDRVGVIIASGIGGLGLRGRSARLQRRVRPSLQPLLHPQDDLGYLRRSRVDEVWFPRAQLLHGFGLCFVYERTDRCLPPHSPR